LQPNQSIAAGTVGPTDLAAASQSWWDDRGRGADTMAFVPENGRWPADYNAALD